MPSYEYLTRVDLVDDDEARQVLHLIHAAICGGETNINEDGTVDHECARTWAIQISEFRPVNPNPEAEVIDPAEVEVEWDDEASAIAQASHLMGVEDGLV